MYTGRMIDSLMMSVQRAEEHVLVRAVANSKDPDQVLDIRADPEVLDPANIDCDAHGFSPAWSHPRRALGESSAFQPAETEFGSFSASRIVAERQP